MLVFLTEDNKDLRGRVFMPGRDVVRHLEASLGNYSGDRNVSGYKRLCNLVDSCRRGGGISYDELRRLKNWFDHNSLSSGTSEYYLNGGNVMKAWVEMTLSNATQAVRDYKEAKRKAGIDNAFRKKHNKKASARV